MLSGHDPWHADICEEQCNGVLRCLQTVKRGIRVRRFFDQITGIFNDACEIKANYGVVFNNETNRLFHRP